MDISILLTTVAILLCMLVFSNGGKWIREKRIQRAIKKGEDLPYSCFVSITGPGVVHVDSRVFTHSKEGRGGLSRQLEGLKKIRERRERGGKPLKNPEVLGGIELGCSKSA